MLYDRVEVPTPPHSLTPALAALAFLHTFDRGSVPPGGIAYEPLLRRLKLDYAPASLGRVDVFLDALRTTKKPRREPFLSDPAGQNLLLLLAFYVAEVIGRTLHCAPQWQTWEAAQRSRPGPGERVFETSMLCDFPVPAARVAQFAPLIAICDRLFHRQVDKSVAFSAGQLIPAPLQGSTQAPPPARTPVAPEDVAKALARCTPMQRAKLEIVPPPWADGDPLERFFAGARDVLRTGRPVWASLIQANKSLFKPEPYGGAPGEIVYDPTGRAPPEALDEVAELLASLKGQALPDPTLAAFSAYLTDETTRVFGIDVPQQICPYPMKVSTTFFDRGYLPGHRITQRSFPVVVGEQHPGIAVFLPAVLWPAPLAKAWAAAAG